MLQDKVKSVGKLNVVLTKGNGEVVEYDYNNLVVTTGRNYIASRMASAADDVMDYMALGSGDTAAVLADTALEDEEGRVALTVAGGTHTGNTVTYAATFGAGVATGAITEAGIFNDDTAGTMLCRTVFPVINKQPADSIAVTWIVSIV